MKNGLLRSGVCILGLALPCAAQDDLVLAQIADQPIAVSEFRAYAANIPEAYQMGKTGIEADRILLNGLIDKKLLLAERNELVLATNGSLSTSSSSSPKSRPSGSTEVSRLISGFPLSKRN